MSYLFFRLDEADTPVAAAPNDLPSFPASLWRPTFRNVAPAGASGPAFVAWWAMALARLFPNGDYGQLVYYDGDTLVHRSGIFPRYLRFPFMGDDDLQIGYTWTHEAYRGRGLATAAIRQAVTLMARPGRSFWYIVDAGNTPSIRAVQKVGFSLVSVGERKPRLGVSALGAYVMSPHASPPHLS
jgi:RimJ/RimL family protein N-acetyltransferase